jgi:hypothetical protein
MLRVGGWRGRFGVATAATAIAGGCAFDYDLFHGPGGDGGNVGGLAGGGTSSTAAGGGGVGGTGATGAGGAGGDAPGGSGGGPCVNRALEFDGDDDRVALDPSPTLNGLTAFTVEAWINADRPVDGGEWNIVSHHDHDDRVGWVFFVRNAELVVRIYALDQFYVHAAPIRLSPGSWHHVAATFDATGMALFLDGARLGLPIGVPVPGPEPYAGSTCIGASSATDDYHWEGLIDEVRISNVARYSGGTYPVPTAPFQPDASTLALFHFDEADGTQAVLDAANQLGGQLGTLDRAESSDPQRIDAPCISAF